MLEKIEPHLLNLDPLTYLGLAPSSLTPKSYELLDKLIAGETVSTDIVRSLVGQFVAGGPPIPGQRLFESRADHQSAGYQSADHRSLGKFGKAVLKRTIVL